MTTNLMRILQEIRLDHLSVKKAMLTMYLFMYIFSPPIISNLRITFDIINLLFFLYVYLLKESIEGMRLSLKVIRMNALLFFFLAYCFLNGIYFEFIEKPNSIFTYQDGEFLKTLIRLLAVMGRITLICFVFNYIRKKLNMNLDSFTNIILSAGMVQFVCVILALIFPEVREWFLSTINANTEGVMQNAILVSQGGDQRCYGFADNLFDSIGYVVSFIFSISFIKAISRNEMKYYIVSLCMVFISLLNTRTGILLNVICVFIVLLFYLNNNPKKYMIPFAVTVILAFGIIGWFINIMPESTMKWMMIGFDELISFLFYQEYTGIFLTFYMDHLNFPNDIILGDGAIPEVDYYNVSDIGYIQCVWRYGVLGTVMLVLGWLYFFYVCYKENRCDLEMKCFVLCAGAVFFIYQIKLFSLYNLGAFSVFVPILVISLIAEKHNTI